MIKKQLQRLRLLLTKILAEGVSPKQVARGLAIGVFMGVIPLMGLQIITATLISFKLKGNKIATVIGTWISNPITFAPLYYINYIVGCFILPKYQIITKTEFEIVIHKLSFANSLDLGEKLLVPLLCGSLINALFFALVTYYISKFFYKKYYIKKQVNLYRKGK